MGIYPEVDLKRFDGNTKLVFTGGTPGLLQVKLYELVGEYEIRTDCFCCSCGVPHSSSMDPHCRNHGFDGRRPCDVHRMPGQEAEQCIFHGNTRMPESVQKYTMHRLGLDG